VKHNNSDEDDGGEDEDDYEDETEAIPVTRALLLQLTTGQWVVMATKRLHSMEMMTLR